MSEARGPASRPAGRPIALSDPATKETRRRKSLGVVVGSSEMQSPLPQFMILIYEREAPESALAAPPSLLEAHLRLPRQVTETGARIIAGNAMGPTSNAVSIRDNVPVGGSLAGSERTLAGYFLVEALDLDHAVWIGRMIPVIDGWVEVRPVLTS
jgi:hypothetical protein